MKIVVEFLTEEEISNIFLIIPIHEFKRFYSEDNHFFCSSKYKKDDEKYIIYLLLER